MYGWKLQQAKPEFAKLQTVGINSRRATARHGDTGCHLSINGAFRMGVRHVLGGRGEIYHLSCLIRCA